MAILCLPTLPIGHPSLWFSKESDGDAVYVVQGFLRPRKVMVFLFVIGPRFFIAWLLMYSRTCVCLCCRPLAEAVSR